MEFPASLQSHHTKLGDHERRLNDHDTELGKQRTTITNVRIELARLLVIAAIGTAIFSAASTALIVHYLTPRHAPAVSSR